MAPSISWRRRLTDCEPGLTFWFSIQLGNDERLIFSTGVPVAINGRFVLVTITGTCTDLTEPRVRPLTLQRGGLTFGLV